MCKYCNGTGKYQLLNKLVDCDQCNTDDKPDSAVDDELAQTAAHNAAVVQRLLGRQIARTVDEWVTADDDIDEVPF